MRRFRFLKDGTELHAKGSHPGFGRSERRVMSPGGHWPKILVAFDMAGGSHMTCRQIAGAVSAQFT